MIIDAQVHEPVPAHSTGSEQDPAVATEVLVASMDAAGVDRAVVTSARAEFVDHACRAFPERFGHLVDLQPGDPDPEGRVRAVREDRTAVGLRVRVATPPQRRLTDAPAEGIEKLRRGDFDPIFAAAAAQGVPACVYASGHLPDLKAVCERFPGLTLVIDHLGLLQPLAIFDPPSQCDTPPFRRLDELLALAEFPGVAVKVSGVPTLSTQPYPFPDVIGPLCEVLAAFGPQRLLWGSDIQRCRMQFRFEGFRSGIHAATGAATPGRHTYAEALHFLKDSAAFDEETKRALLGGNALRWLDWSNAAGPAAAVTRLPDTTSAPEER
ncbi:amidohydrolase family protein [Pseudonocardia sp. GCM10023141]|uniref:amidohydrolase family protein n=1 Tax=Pseudonocardia sp. GCM10023141 TaxID=3252653 RepID=UPI00361749C4